MEYRSSKIVNQDVNILDEWDLSILDESGVILNDQSGNEYLVVEGVISPPTTIDSYELELLFKH